ncbi:hypothetical protein D0868_10678 [Hortaea werneckii]|uniref:Uncharacterized protein n=1 Tax=Hortaea werneckii TaxID=91943 RepID=A0A3M6Y3I3_HORWE|nr:hypothetical protein D0868_10678 [Hortaea werneckii]RMY14918.1 hypothetical protein D0866_13874 [Hortaea werneckii]
MLATSPSHVKRWRRGSQVLHDDENARQNHVQPGESPRNQASSLSTLGAEYNQTQPFHEQSRDAQCLAKMFGITNKMLYSGSALFATTTAFIPVWISLALPIRHETVGPYNYHRVAKRAARLPWKRLPKAL